MSFNAQGYGKPLMDDQFSSQMKSIQQELNQIDSSIKKATQYYDLLGTDADTKLLRVKIQETLSKITQDIKICDSHINQLGESENHNQINQKRKAGAITSYKTHLSKLSKQFQFIASQITQKQRAHLELARRSFTSQSSPKNNSNHNVSSNLSNGGGFSNFNNRYLQDQYRENGEDDQFLYPQQQYSQQQLKLTQHADVQQQSLRERQEDLNCMAKIMQDIHKIQISVSENVVGQGKLINMIDTNVSQGYTNTSKGLQNLKQAEKKQKSGTKCLCFLVGFVFIIIVIMLLIIFA